MSKLLNQDPSLQLYIDYNTGEHRETIDVNACFYDLGSDVCDALPFFHCFTGADSTCSFFKKSKKSLYGSWMKSESKEELTSTFKNLSNLPTEDIINESAERIYQFVVAVYGGPQNVDLNSYRFSSFQQLCSNDLRCLPPTQDSLLLHIKRSAYQAGWI